MMEINRKSSKAIMMLFKFYPISTIKRKRIKSLISFFFVLCSWLFLSLLVTDVYAQRVLTNTGKDFWFGFMDNSISMEPGDQPNLFIFVTAPEEDSEVTIEVPGYKDAQNKPYKFTKKLSAGETYQHKLPKTGTNSVTKFVHNVVSDKNQNTAVHVYSDQPINVYILNQRPFTTDMSIVYPSGVIGDRYIVSAYDELPEYIGSPPGEPLPVDWKSEFLIVARFDSTIITITPSASVQKNGGGTRPRKTPYQIILMAGECYQGQSFGDLTGTLIESIGCKPFAVFGGNQCTSVGKCSSCDHIFEQMVPLPPSASTTEKWNEYVLYGSKVRLSDTYRFMAVEEGETNIEVFTNKNDPTFSEKIKLNGVGDFFQKSYQTTALKQAFYLKSDKRITVTLYNQGDDCDPEPNNSDPFMILVPPNEMMRRSEAYYSVYDFPSSRGTPWKHMTNIICRSTEKGKLSFDGDVVTADRFIPVIGNDRYSVIVFEGGKEFATDHYIESDSGVIAYSYGYSFDDSYGYTAAVSFINTPIMDSRIAERVDVQCFGDSTGKVRFDAQGGLPIQYVDENGEDAFAYKAVLKYEKTPGVYSDIDHKLLKVMGKDKKLFSYNDIVGQFKTKLDSIRYYRDTVTTFYGLWNGNYRAYIYPDSGCVQIQSFVIRQPAEVIIRERDSICRQKNTYTPPPANVPDGIWCSVNGVVIDPLTGEIDLNQNALKGVNELKVLYKTKAYDQKTDLKCADPDGCTKTMTLLIFDDPKPDFSYSAYKSKEDTVFLPYSMVEFKYLTPDATSWDWDFGDGGVSTEKDPRHKYDENQEKTVDVKLKITDINGCVGENSKKIILKKTTEFYIHVPNIFTVNNDGLNDRFVLDHLGIAEFTMTIYDRWGMRVYTSNSIDETWDGKVLGKSDASEGQYFWVFRAKTVTDLEINRAGSVTLIR